MSMQDDSKSVVTIYLIQAHGRTFQMHWAQSVRSTVSGLTRTFSRCVHERDFLFVLSATFSWGRQIHGREGSRPPPQTDRVGGWTKTDQGLDASTPRTESPRLPCRRCIPLGHTPPLWTARRPGYSWREPARTTPKTGRR
eukprot:5442306-Amphidinium_carterae.1